MEPWIPIAFDFVKWIMIAVVIVWLSNRTLDELLKHKQRLSLHQMQIDKSNKSFNQKLQAYERLMLFLDRISIPNLIMRLQSPESRADLLSASMLISIQKEFEHNVTQQLYVKDNLWHIITLIKDEISAGISIASEEQVLGSNSDFINAVMEYHQTKGQILIAKGQQAIKEEAGLILN
jgi:hypothetical protein